MGLAKQLTLVVQHTKESLLKIKNRARAKCNGRVPGMNTRENGRMILSGAQMESSPS